MSAASVKGWPSIPLFMWSFQVPSLFFLLGFHGGLGMPKCHFCHILFIKTHHKVKEKRNKLHFLREMNCVYREGWICWRPSLKSNYHFQESFTFHSGRDFYLYVIGQNWVTWPALAARESGNSSILLSSSAVEEGKGERGWSGCCVSCLQFLPHFICYRKAKEA